MLMYMILMIVVVYKEEELYRYPKMWSKLFIMKSLKQNLDISCYYFSESIISLCKTCSSVLRKNNIFRIGKIKDIEITTEV